MPTKTTVIRAKGIRTMDYAVPYCDTVVVRDGRILEVGTMDSVSTWLERGPYEVDDRFRNHYLMPGFVDPHLHPGLGALVLPLKWVTAFDWKLPGRDSKAVKGHNEFLSALRDLDVSMPSGEPLVVWGYHQLWHGNIDRRSLNLISNDRPIVLWHRGYHSLFLNDKAMEWVGLSKADVLRHPQMDAERGLFVENGMAVVKQRLRPFLLEPNRIESGYNEFRRVAQAGGITTMGDMAHGIIAGPELEWDLATRILERDDTPFRVQFTPTATPGAADDAFDMEAHVREITSWRKTRRTHRLHFGRSVKLFVDGGFFSSLMQLRWPGRTDGGHGEWMTPPERFQELAKYYWDRGFILHVHTSADLGMELVLETLEMLQAGKPRFGRKFIIEHLGISSPEQIERAARLGADASVNIYYLYELGYRYWKEILGYERASQMSRLGSMERSGMRFAIHSDFIASPATPLANAWIAVNRLAETGDLMAPTERISVERALRAITIDAAYMLGMEDDVGSIRSGKRADFTILDRDPISVPPEDLNKIQISGTIFEGNCFLN